MKTIFSAIIMVLGFASVSMGCELPDYETYVNIYDNNNLQLVEQYAMNPVKSVKGGVMYISATTQEGYMIDYVAKDVFLEVVEAPHFLHRGSDGLPE